MGSLARAKKRLWGGNSPQSREINGRVQSAPGSSRTNLPGGRKGNPRGSVLTSPTGLSMHRSASPCLQMLLSLEETTLILLFSIWFFNRPCVPLIGIRNEHHLLCDVRGFAEGEDCAHTERMDRSVRASLGRRGVS